MLDTYKQSVGMIRVGATRGFEKIVRASGGDVQKVLAAAELSESTFSETEARITLESYANLLEAAADETGCDSFGATFGAVFDTRNLGAAGYLFRHAASLGDALQHFSRNFDAVQGNTDLDLEIQDGMARVTYRVHDAKRYQRKQDAEFSIAMLAQACIAATGNRAMFRRVEFEHGCGADRAFYTHHFDAEARFGQPTNAFYFPAVDLEARLPEHDPYLLALLSGVIADALRDIRAQTGLMRDMHAVMEELRQRNPYSSISAGEIAAELGISQRTLHRRLEAQGTNFRKFRSMALMSQAKALLHRKTIAITEIAFQLGFSDASAFSRAFRAETGISPKKYRAMNG